MFVLAGVQVLGVAANAAAVRSMLAVLPESEREGLPGVLAIMVGTHAVISLGVIVVLVTLAVLNRRGNAASRILTWVLGALYFCLTSVGGAVDVVRVASPDSPFDLTWVVGIQVGLLVLMLALTIAIAVLLARPASNAFFGHKTS
jgi:hypothetical protein